METIKRLNQNQDESKFEKIRNVGQLIEKNKLAEQRYLEEKEKFEKAKAEAEKDQAMEKEVKALVHQLRELTKEKERRIDDLRSSNLAKSADRVRSIRERMKLLPRNTHIPSPLPSIAELRIATEAGLASTSTATEDPSTSGAEARSTSTETEDPSASTE